MKKQKSLKTPKALKRAEGIYFAEVDGEYYLTLEEKDVVICLNPVAFAVVENLDGFTSIETIKKQLVTTKKMDEKKISSAVDGLVKDLRGLGVLDEVDQGGKGTRAMQISPELLKSGAIIPEIIGSWKGKELAGGMFINSGDIHVIVPNVTDGPIKTCPPHTCTIPAGLFTPETIIRTFDRTWRKNFEPYRCTKFVNTPKDKGLL